MTQIKDISQAKVSDDLAGTDLIEGQEASGGTGSSFRLTLANLAAWLGSQIAVFLRLDGTNAMTAPLDLGSNAAGAGEITADDDLVLSSGGGTGEHVIVDKFRLSDTVFDDLVVPMTTVKQGATTKPDFDTTNVGLLWPKNDTTEIGYAVVQFPHKWKEGTDVYPHVHVDDTDGAAYVMKMDYKWYNVGDTEPASWTTYTMSTKAATWVSGTLGQILYNATPISGTGKTLSSIMKVKLYRDDNVGAADLLATSFDIHHEIDSLGSEDEYTKD